MEKEPILPENAMSFAEELAMLRKRVKDQDKEIRRLKGKNEFLEEASAFFRREPSEVSKNEKIKFIAIKTDDGRIKGKLAFLLSYAFCQSSGIL